MYKDESIGVHDLYKQLGLHISYEKADEISRQSEEYEKLMGIN